LKQISVRMICFPDFFFVCFCWFLFNHGYAG
jgi:hypothetical protein